ncbi:MAG: PCP reductase family protein [Gemmatimonadota bacterium]|nr:PCP reductase family protein [Candidatus Palauibacterales bacterium]
MKFLCVECDAQMESFDKGAPGDGTLALMFRCPECHRQIAMLTNPQETQMVSSLCVHIGGRTTAEQPFEAVRTQLETGGESALKDVAAKEGDPAWTEDAEERLQRTPGFVRGMVRRLYCDWARDRGIDEVTLEVMDSAKADLGLEGGGM